MNIVQLADFASALMREEKLSAPEAVARVCRSTKINPGSITSSQILSELGRRGGKKSKGKKRNRSTPAKPLEDFQSTNWIYDEIAEDRLRGGALAAEAMHQRGFQLTGNLEAYR